MVEDDSPKANSNNLFMSRDFPVSDNMMLDNEDFTMEDCEGPSFIPPPLMSSRHRYENESFRVSDFIE